MLTDDQMEQYRRDGCTFYPGFLSKGEIVSYQPRNREYTGERPLSRYPMTSCVAANCTDNTKTCTVVSLPGKVEGGEYFVQSD